MIGERTRIAVRERADGLNAGEVQGMLRELREHVLGEHADVTPGDEAFASGARVTDLLVFVNVAADPMRVAREQGLQRVSNRIDSLGYSALRENLVLNVETVARNSWGELVSARHAGVEGLLRCLRDFLPLAHGNAGLRVAVRCFCPSRAEPIATRMGEVFGDLARHFHRERGARRPLRAGDPQPAARAAAPARREQQRQRRRPGGALRGPRRAAAASGPRSRSTAMRWSARRCRRSPRA